ncbi:MAG: hypothetical protein COV78_00715 [Candidatus Pacebacteria bacterium CG11_big_fil_rev_8_21_14_0_20_34_55]|nr:MAG: hypothetical protein COV78_00715 [Candidatus Pacebacteria bacterium CG11_big_fil_rev_8_21_14_0_20_34_55]
MNEELDDAYQMTGRETSNNRKDGHHPKETKDSEGKKEKSGFSNQFREKIFKKVFDNLQSKYPDQVGAVVKILRILANATKLSIDFVPMIGTIGNIAEIGLKKVNVDMTPDVSKALEEKFGKNAHKKLKTAMFILDTVTTFLPIPLSSLDNAIQIVIDFIALGHSTQKIIETIMSKKANQFPKSSLAVDRAVGQFI